jgi:hypothetical protein
MCHWFENGAADGFNVMAPVMPGDLQRFIDHVMPLLRRVRPRQSTPVDTLRERYGLKSFPGVYMRGLADWGS